MHRIGIDFKATLPQTVLGLVGGVVAYRYFIKPVVSPPLNDSSKKLASPTTSSLLGSKISSPSSSSSSTTTAFSVWNNKASQNGSPTIHALDSIETLNRIGQGRAVILITRGYNKKDTERALTVFQNSLLTLHNESKDNNNNNNNTSTTMDTTTTPIEYYIIDDDSDQIPATTLLTRLGITHDKPFVMILDNFINTEKKYLMTTRSIPQTKEIIQFIKDYQHQRIQPALLGQIRPPNDRSPHCKDLVEVVTDSFVELVLDPSTDVLLESYTKSCDACRAFAPRYRMLAQLSARYIPKLRVASIDIRDNDRDVRYLPEKWTPAIRLFPTETTEKEHRKDTPSTNNGNPKKSILLNYADDPTRNNNVSSSTTENTSASSSVNKVYLPTLPELLTFVSTHTNGRVPLTSELMNAATLAEEDAAMLETAYDQTLQYMRLWQAYNTMLDDEEEESKTTPADGTKSPPSPPDIKKRRQISERMKNMVIDTYSFIVDKAALGGLDTAMTKLDQVSDFVEKKGISRELSIAAAKADALVGNHADSARNSKKLS